jgi:hypothetical protein
VEGSCEQRNVPASGSIKGGEFFDWLSNNELLTNCAPWSEQPSINISKINVSFNNENQSYVSEGSV